MREIDAKIRNKKLKGKMILQVHDELVFDVPKDEVEEFKILIKESMENIIETMKSEIIENAIFCNN